ncbi:hypothetical protein [Streptomyces sp. 1222.5]|uniref:hypothetical protein n=1 Tax=Streptomyces sp. 1222.5 TaxID=1881026 RepID=UPI003EBE1D67
MAKVIVLPGVAVRGGARSDGIAVDKDFDGVNVASKVAGVVIDLGQRVRGDLHIVGGGFGSSGSEPFLQLEQGHGLLGVVKLAGMVGTGPVAGDVAANVGGGNAGFPAEHRDDRPVDVVLGGPAGAKGEHEVRALVRLRVEDGGLVGADRLPGLDRLPQQRVDGLGERDAGLVGGDVEQADGIPG